MDGTERRDLCTTEVRARTRRIGGESGASVFSAVTGAPERPHHESIFSARAKWRSARGLKADGGSARSGALRWQPRSSDSTTVRGALHAYCASKGGAQRVETCWEDGELRATPDGAPRALWTTIPHLFSEQCGSLLVELEELKGLDACTYFPPLGQR